MDGDSPKQCSGSSKALPGDIQLIYARMQGCGAAQTLQYEEYLDHPWSALGSRGGA